MLIAAPDISVVMKEGWETSLGAVVVKRDSPADGTGADEGKRSMERGSLITFCIGKVGHVHQDTKWYTYAYGVHNDTIATCVVMLGEFCIECG